MIDYFKGVWSRMKPTLPLFTFLIVLLAVLVIVADVVEAYNVVGH